MTTTTQTQTQTQIQARTGMLTLLFVAILGLALITLTGHVQAATLHDAAHDVRHATGFPCH